MRVLYLSEMETMSPMLLQVCNLVVEHQFQPGFFNPDGPTPLPVPLEGYYEDSTTWREKLTGAVID